MFIVIEGIDGAGCETQAKNLQKLFKKNGRESFILKYPNYEKNIGRFIKDFLYKNKNLTAEEQFLLYSLQFLMDKEEIVKKRKKGVLIADRYFTSTLCYQALEGINLEKALRFAKDFNIEKPDLVFYLKVTPEVAIKRKKGELKEKNRREKDFRFIKKTYHQYKKLIEKQIWANWIEINGQRPIDEITQEIYDKIIALINHG